jgi:hypothetical protein
MEKTPSGISDIEKEYENRFLETRKSAVRSGK